MDTCKYLENTICKLKQESELKKLEVYNKLLQLGYEFDFVKIECPFIHKNLDFNLCPFKK